MSRNIQEGALSKQATGQKVQAAFVVIHIRHFTHLCEVFKENIVAMVNQVARIVHTVTDAHGGFVDFYACSNSEFERIFVQLPN